MPLQLDIPIITSVTNLDDAELALNTGVDGLIAQGIEAGGHRGTFDPLPITTFEQCANHTRVGRKA